MRTFFAFARVSLALAADVVTLGGACNDAYFHNGRRTYTQKALDDIFPRPLP